MLFEIQTYLEDYLNRRNLVDTDGYAVRLANLYFHSRAEIDTDQFLRKVGRISSLIFINNRIKDRAGFEKGLVARLDYRFKKKLRDNSLTFPGGTEVERIKLQRLPRITIGVLLVEFKRAIEARAIDTFWISRKRGELRQKPEKIAQGHFALFTRGVLLTRRGIVLRELSSGIGFVDIGILFSSTLHLVEIKVFTGKFEGPEQLEQYMKTEQRREGSLLVIDALAPDSKVDLPETIVTPFGAIKVYPVNINPPLPSSLN